MRQAGIFLFRKLKKDILKHPPQARNLRGIFFYPKIFHTFEAEEKTSN